MEARSRRTLPSFTIALAIAVLTPASANAEVAHVVQPGETLWSIAAANNLTTRTVAVYNGLPETAGVVVGETVMVPTVEEGAAALAGAGVSAAPAGTVTEPVADSSSAGHTVVAGESLSSIAAANGLAVEELAAANGRPSDSLVYEGETLVIPAPTATGAPTGSTAGLGHVPSPSGELHLAPAAADSWNSMRDASLSTYGVDIYPGGPASAYRTTEQQQELYDLYLSGQGAPAAPPGTSSHEIGNSVDVETPEMRSVVDQIGGAYGWGKLEAPDEWWHVSYGG